jgi:hypothetical protein
VTWPQVVLVALNTFSVVALAWIAAWQQRAAQQVRKLNGAVVDAISEKSRAQPPMDH